MNSLDEIKNLIVSSKYPLIPLKFPSPWMALPGSDQHAPDQPGRKPENMV